MKAKEYAKKYLNAQAAGKTRHDACTDMLVEFLREISVLTVARRVQGCDALVAVFRELDNKWAAVCAICPELPRWGFYGAVEHVQPEVWKTLIKLMPEIKRRSMS